MFPDTGIMIGEQENLCKMPAILLKQVTRKETTHNKTN